ncbi:MAG: TA system VapC family ribonuclease toxin [Pirellulaceae bacterium]
MIALLDASLLIALFDAAHVNHAAAHAWLTANRSSGWATCPLTQNACLRVLSHPNYPGHRGVADISRRISNAIAAPDHVFWMDSISLCDSNRFRHDQVLSPRHLTDLYLLALALEHDGRLVTFDRGIPLAAVSGAQAKHLEVV